jgi:hypothetical protein
LSAPVSTTSVVGHTGPTSVTIVSSRQSSRSASSGGEQLPRRDGDGTIGTFLRPRRHSRQDCTRVLPNRDDQRKPCVSRRSCYRIATSLRSARAPFVRACREKSRLAAIRTLKGDSPAAHHPRQRQKGGAVSRADFGTGRAACIRVGTASRRAVSAERITFMAVILKWRDPRASRRLFPVTGAAP